MSFLQQIFYSPTASIFRRFDIKGVKKTFSFSFDPDQISYDTISKVSVCRYPNHFKMKPIQKIAVSFSVLFSWSFLDGGKSAVLQYSEAFHSPPSSSFCCQTLLMAFLFHQNAMCCSILYHRTFLAEFQEKNRLCISLVALPVLCPAERVSGQ